jgi:small subunit ribosomal protein S2
VWCTTQGPFFSKPSAQNNKTLLGLMLHSQLRVMLKLLKTNAHWGYRRPFSDFQPYLYGFRNDMAIIDLEKTLIGMRRACNVIEFIMRSNGHLLFVNTNSEYNRLIQLTAKLTAQSYVNHKWIGGLLTNWHHMQHVQQHFQAFAENYGQHKSGALSSGLLPNHRRSEQPLGVVEQASWDLSTPYIAAQAREAHNKPPILSKQVDAASAAQLDGPRFQKMQKCFEGLVAREEIPDCLILCNSTHTSIAIQEARLLQIPIIAFVDANVPNKVNNLITYPIPANEASLPLLYLFCNCIIKTILLSKQKQH